MKKPQLAPWRQTGVFFCTALILTGLFTFQHLRVLSAIGVGGLVLLALTQPNPLTKWKALTRQRYFLALMLVFLVHLLTFFYTGQAYYGPWWAGLMLKLPFLLLPLAFSFLGPWPVRWLSLLYYFFFCLVFLAALYSLARYLADFQQINQSYHRAGVMPTLVNHVRFSLMVAFAIFIGIKLYWQGFFWRFSGERKWIGALTVFLFVFLHLLAVRSGLLVFYGLGFPALVYWLFRRRKARQVLLLMGFLAGVPVLSFLCLPTFREKLHYTVYDYAQRHDETKANNYSLTGRLYSYRVGLALWQQRPLLGWGPGQMPQAIQQTYQEAFPGIRPEAYLISHNQFLYYLGLLGILGLILFLAGFYYPLLACFRQADELFVVHYLIVSFSFLVEATLETQVGLLYSLIFILLPLVTISGKGNWNKSS